MFEGLDAIPWDNLTHPYGSACMFPIWIRMLTVVNEPMFTLAISEIGYIASIGEVADGADLAFYIVPFLIQLTEKGGIYKGKDKIISLLFDIMFEVEDVIIRDSDSKDGAIKVYNYFMSRIPLFLSFLEDYRPEVRLQAARLLSYFHKQEDLIRPSLEKLFDIERNEGVQKAILFSISELAIPMQ